MSKIAIISQPDQGVLIDVEGCQSLDEAVQYLTSTLNDSSQFWEGLEVNLSLGKLVLDGHEVDRILSIASEMGVEFTKVFASDEKTIAWLKERNVKVGEGAPTALNSEQNAETVDEGYESEIMAVAVPGFEPTDTKSGAKKKSKSKKNVAPAPGVLFLRQTLRSGQTVTHKGHLIIVGDVNPGAEVIADGDITIWGALRGVAHAGASGNTDSQIRALKLRPMQLRIAHSIARAPDRPHTITGYAGPETARIVNGQIRISVNTPE